MKIEINSQQRSDIEASLAQLNPAIESLRNSFARQANLSNWRDDNNSAYAQAGAAENPSDKQIEKILICRERAAILEDRANEMATKITLEKKALVDLANGVMEIFRIASGKQLLAQGEADLKATLPPALLADSHLVFKIWNEGAERRRLGAFLNPTALTPHGDGSEILEESGRRAQLLENLLHGREMFSKSQAVVA